MCCWVFDIKKYFYVDVRKSPLSLHTYKERHTQRYIEIVIKHEDYQRAGKQESANGKQFRSPHLNDYCRDTIRSICFVVIKIRNDSINVVICILLNRDSVWSRKRGSRIRDQLRVDLEENELAKHCAEYQKYLKLIEIGVREIVLI